MTTTAHATNAAATAAFSTANPHALAVILDAAETRSIIASRDIFDISGIKLWARSQPVSHELRRKLMDRQLRQPLEACLMAQDGVTTYTLVQAVERLLAGDSPLVPMLKPVAHKLARETSTLPIHSVAQLLLTASHVSRAEHFEHSVQAMLLNGALSLARGASTPELRTAMIAGLLHDVGEIYIDPRHGEADAGRSLDFDCYRELVVHPHVGRLLIEQLTDYPRSVALAIAEHHERLDGSGYPHRLDGNALSPLGRQLAVADATLQALREPGTPLARAGVALRVVPGEFDLGWVGVVTRSVRGLAPLQPRQSRDQIQRRLAGLDQRLKDGMQQAEMFGVAADTLAFKEALALTAYLLQRLRNGWNASGLWIATGVDDAELAEIEVVEDELRSRLMAIQCAAQLRAGALPIADAGRMTMLCESLGERLL